MEKKKRKLKFFKSNEWYILDFIVFQFFDEIFVLVKKKVYVVFNFYIFIYCFYFFQVKKLVLWIEEFFVYVVLIKICDDGL